MTKRWAEQCAKSWQKTTKAGGGLRLAVVLILGYAAVVPVVKEEVVVGGVVAIGY